MQVEALVVCSKKLFQLRSMRSLGGPTATNQASEVGEHSEHKHVGSISARVDEVCVDSSESELSWLQ